MLRNIKVKWEKDLPPDTSTEYAILSVLRENNLKCGAKVSLPRFCKVAREVKERLLQEEDFECIIDFLETLLRE